MTVIEAEAARIVGEMLDGKGHAVAALAIRKALEADARAKAEPRVDHLSGGYPVGGESGA